jgi:hypothetical protein
VLCYDSLDDMDMSKVTSDDRGLSLTLIQGLDYQINKTIFVMVNNNSDNYIWMPKGYLLKIIRKTENENGTEKIEDKLNRKAVADIILSPRGSDDTLYDSSNGLILYPYIQTPRDIETIYVEVFGFEYQDGKICDKMYPATIEITLFDKPSN